MHVDVLGGDVAADALVSDDDAALRMDVDELAIATCRHVVAALLGGRARYERLLPTRERVVVVARHLEDRRVGRAKGGREVRRQDLLTVPAALVLEQEP